MTGGASRSDSEVTENTADVRAQVAGRRGGRAGLGAGRAGFWAGGSGTAGWAGSGWTRDGLAREERKREWAAWAEVVGRTGFWIFFSFFSIPFLKQTLKI